MANDQIVADDKVIIIHYTLRNSKGEELDTSIGGEPMPYLHGADNIVPGLENQLTGKSVGEKLTVEVTPEEGYGLAEGEGPMPVPRENFEPGVELEVGMNFMAEGPGGQPIPLWIAKIEGEQVYVDTNHPLAGETLYFEVEIVGVREALPVEIAHGHPHGLTGSEHHH